jgi:hypothetical protein
MAIPNLVLMDLMRKEKENMMYQNSTSTKNLQVQEK